MFQQIELIINTLCTQELEIYIKENLNEYVNSWTDKVNGIQKGKKFLWQYLSHYFLEKSKRVGLVILHFVATHDSYRDQSVENRIKTDYKVP